MTAPRQLTAAEHDAIRAQLRAAIDELGNMPLPSAEDAQRALERLFAIASAAATPIVGRTDPKA